MEGNTVEFKEFKAKTVEEAISVASIELGVASTDLEIEVVDDGSKGFLGIGSKPAIIKVKKKESFLDDIQEYLDDGWEFNGRNNGYHVLSKPSEVRATLEAKDIKLEVDLRPYILNYYNLKVLREARAKEVINDIKAGNINIYLSDDNTLILC